MDTPTIASAVSRFVSVHDVPMHYLEIGTGRPIVLLHGNPTSSYLWRHVLPHLATCHRCVAPDLIGMGRSAKPNIAYTLRDHLSFLEVFLAAIGLERVTVVGHDWGVALGSLLIARNPTLVDAFAFMEGRVRPVARWSDLDPGEAAFFRGLRSDGDGRRRVLEENAFIEEILPSGMLRQLTEEEFADYRAPYPTPRDRAPLWAWVREVPIGGDPPDAAALMTEVAQALQASPIPKLLLHADPGAVMGAADIAWCRDHLRNLTIVDIGAGIHFLPEDQPKAIASELLSWLAS